MDINNLVYFIHLHLFQLKLDGYRQKYADGEELNADQKVCLILHLSHSHSGKATIALQIMFRHSLAIYFD